MLQHLKYKTYWHSLQQGVVKKLFYESLARLINWGKILEAPQKRFNESNLLIRNSTLSLCIQHNVIFITQFGPPIRVSLFDDISDQILKKNSYLCDILGF